MFALVGNICMWKLHGFIAIGSENIFYGSRWIQLRYITQLLITGHLHNSLQENYRPFQYELKGVQV